MPLRSQPIDPVLFDAATTIAVGGTADDIVEFVVRELLAPDRDEPAPPLESVCAAVVALVLAAMRAQRAVDRARAHGENLPGDDLEPTEIEPLGGQGA
jgi:hypothetical protein